LKHQQQEAALQFVSGPLKPFAGKTLYLHKAGPLSAEQIHLDAQQHTASASVSQ